MIQLILSITEFSASFKNLKKLERTLTRIPQIFTDFLKSYPRQSASSAPIRVLFPDFLKTLI